jgi:hypothetical protein
VRELPVQFLDYLRMIKHYFRHERAGLEVAPPFALEEIPFSAHHGATCQRLD